MDPIAFKALSSPVSMVQPVAPLSPAAVNESSFQSIFQNAIDQVKAPRQVAEQQIQAFLNGEQTDIHQVALSMQKADLTFELALELRNKVMQAYQEIMRMQV
jgi:flagellar hook-basal body complex protein FliE